MADEIGGLNLNGDRKLAAVLLMTSGMYTLDAYSTLLSSPWTAESFGGDPGKSQSLKGYMRHAIFFSMAYVVAAAWLADSMWPVIGGAVTNGYLWWLYNRADARGRASGSQSWGDQGG